MCWGKPLEPHILERGYYSSLYMKNPPASGIACYAASCCKIHGVKYICPECHEVFKPTLKEAFWANHTPTARKLTCTACGHKGFCVEVWGGDGE